MGGVKPIKMHLSSVTPSPHENSELFTRWFEYRGRLFGTARTYDKGGAPVYELADLETLAVVEDEYQAMSELRRRCCEDIDVWIADQEREEVEHGAPEKV